MPALPLCARSSSRKSHTYARKGGGSSRRSPRAGDPSRRRRLRRASGRGSPARGGRAPRNGGRHGQLWRLPEMPSRSWLLSLAAPYIERTLGAASSPGAFELLRLGNEALVEAVAPKVASTLLARVDSLPERSFAEKLEAADCWATCRHDPFYPESLREAPGAPWALIARGDPSLLVATSGVTR